MNSSVIAACDECHQPFDYEPIMVLGHDLLRGLPKRCPDCQQRDEEMASQAADAAENQRKLDILNAVIPPDLRATSTRHEEFNIDLWRAVKLWTPTADSRSLGIVGPAAMCKTRVLALYASKVIMRGSRAVWTSAMRLKDAAIDRTRGDRDSSANARQHLWECQHTAWLFLDDLGKNEWGHTFESQLFQILDHRMNHHLPIVWTSNAHPEELHPLITRLNASPIIGRLQDRCTIIDLRPDTP